MGADLIVTDEGAPMRINRVVYQKCSITRLIQQFLNGGWCIFDKLLDRKYIHYVGICFYRHSDL